MIDSVLQFIRSYQWYEVIFEVAVIWVGVWLVYRFLRGTRGAGAIRGFAVLLVVATLAVLVLGQGSEAFARLNYLYERFLGLLAIVLIVVFQPELRQAMIRLGQARIFRDNRGEVDTVVDAITEAVEFLGKNKFGALIAIERSVKLGGLTDTGQSIDAEISGRLLESIFWPNSPLHDLGVVVSGRRIAAANVQFPLAEEGVVPARYGSRHRAAVGLSAETDSIVVIVSEETGQVSIAEHGRLEPDLPRKELGGILRQRLRSTPRTVDEGDAGDKGEPAPAPKMSRPDASETAA